MPFPISIERLDENDLRGKRVLLRLDLNVPIKDGRVENTFRLERPRLTLDWLTARGARVLIMAHLGDPRASLQPIADCLRSFVKIDFVPTLDQFSTTDQVYNSRVQLLENLRQNAGEEKNDPDFAKQLAAHGQIFVNDAFSVSHRPHASIVGLPKLLPSYAGLNFIAEAENLSQLLSPAHPFLAIMGGAKFGTKLPVISKLLTVADRLFIGGALAHSFFRELGYDTGCSLLDPDTAPIRSLLHHGKIILPREVVVRRALSGDWQIRNESPDQIAADETIVDVGQASLDELALVVRSARTILWNGPLGHFESGFTAGTAGLARLIAQRHLDASLPNGGGAPGPFCSIVGGGDTVAALEKLNLLDKFTFVSTAGGAMLDFLAEGTLPGLEALKESQEKFKIT